MKTPPASRRRRSLRMLLAALGAMLVLAFGAVGLLQAHQFKLLNATTRYQDDYLVWSLFQFEVEYLKLRLALEQAAGPSVAIDAEAVEQRYEIFVSRLGLLEDEHAAKILQEHPDYRRTLERSRRFVQWADALPLNAETVRARPQALNEAIERMDGLAEAIRELSLTATHHVSAQVSERNELVRRLNQQSIALTLLQCVLALSFAAVMIRQFRRLARYGREQKALAQRLQDARQEVELGSRAKSVFQAHMSHELRTPMHGLLGMLSLLKDSGLTPAQQGQLQAASDSARHLLSVLNDLLDVSKLEAGGIELHPQPLQLAGLLRELEELSWPQALVKGLDLRIAMDGDVPAWVSADPTRLRQILLNLLGNALKFSEHGRVALQLSRQNDALGRELLRFEVSDTGIGMDAATQARLFQRRDAAGASEADARQPPRFGGGLSLEVSRRLARAMGGDLHVASEPGQGSVFALELRLPACEPPPAAAAAAQQAARATTRLKILVSEDHDTNRTFLAAVLERLGHQAVFCENGLEALQRLKTEDFDLVLMDLHTPMMDGFQAARAMRALPAPKSAVRIIALSADANEAARERALQAGMDDFLAKPVGIEQLSQTIARHGSERPGEPQLAPHLDERTLAELRRHLPEARVRQLYAGFVAGLASTRAALQQAQSRQDSAALRAATHSIKGAAANLGLNLVAEPARALEAALAEAADWLQIERHIGALLEALGRSEALCSERGLA
ncbi:response regulator [Roseateles violae]|uniref:histidine kinase n=1 Tax=Roseateles violae TaxID=3058042 RepID=A0ABT8DP60_9BURK|nr:response regulator [Pelomonas sp. PFR6]MDN3920135.1 response regulator [Pelomonas sp. PFR6]